MSQVFKSRRKIPILHFGEEEKKRNRGKREGRGERSIKSLVLYQLGHSGQLSESGGYQGLKGPSCGCWVWPIGRQAGP